MAVNSGLSAAGGTSVSGFHWSSSEANNSYVWNVYTYAGGMTNNSKDYNYSYVRCVLGFEGKTCDTSYQYDCSGDGEVGVGTACEGKYQACANKYVCEVNEGTHITGSVGEPIDGKYKACSCADGYIWFEGECVTSLPKCEVGYILNSDMSCTKTKEDGKTPIGIVSYANGDTRLAINLVHTEKEWGGYGTDISELTNNYSSDSLAKSDFSGKSNTSKIVRVLGSSSTSYAAGYCYNYTTAGTSKGQWYLPAAGELYASIVTNYSAVNSGLSAAGGTAIQNAWDDWHWSSTGYGSHYAWLVSFSHGDTSITSRYGNSYVRCVLGFEGKTCDASYQYDCTGVGVTGVGTACDGKYQACQCAPEYSKTCTGEGYVGGSGTACNGKYSSCTCASGYEWKNGTCAACDSSYQYTCSGANITGGSGTACGGKYTACTCSSPYTWSNGACSCPSTYQYTCSGTGYSRGL